MNFQFTEDEEIFAKSVRDFLARESTPKHVRQWEASATGFSRETMKKMADMGWFGVCLPEKLGGLGLPFDYLTILFHQLGHFIPHGPIWETVVSGLVLHKAKPSKHRDELLSRMARGEAIGTLTLHPSTPSKKSTILPFVPYAAGSDYILTPQNKGARQCVAVVPAQSVADGLAPVPVTSGERMCHVSLHSRTTRAGMSLPISRPAFETAMDMGRILSTAFLLGISERALEIAVKYAGERAQFGRPIGSFQAVQHLVADIKVKAEGLRLLVYEASWAITQGAATRRLASMAKFWANSTAYTATKNAHQVLGGFGVMAETDLQLFYRRAKGWMINKGDDAAMLDHVAETLP